MTKIASYEIVKSMPQKGLSSVILILVIIVVLTAIAGIYVSNKKNNNEVLPKQVRNYTDLEGNQSTTLSNPASEYCIKVGGELQSKTRGDGGEYSVCNFEDNQSCEEWALYRRNCPIGGIKTIGYDTPEEIYCALIGGKTTAQPNSNCNLPNGNTCSNNDLYNGKCP